MIDFSDPTKPKEIAFADMAGTNTWSAYTYPRRTGREDKLPVYSNDGLSRNYSPPGTPATYPEAAYGFMRFTADIGRTWLVGFDRLNPQLQERVIPNLSNWRKPGASPGRTTRASPPLHGARNHSARPFDK